MVLAHPTRRSADNRLVDRFTRRETPAQRRRRIARTRSTVPKEVAREFEESLTADTARYARAITNKLTHPQERRTMTTKRNSRTKKAEPKSTDTKATKSTPAETKRQARQQAEKIDQADAKIDRYTTKLERAKAKVTRYTERLAHWQDRRAKLGASKRTKK
jgi:hypothetical protein